MFIAISMLFIHIFPSFTLAKSDGICNINSGEKTYDILIDLNDSTLFLIDKKTKKAIKTYPVATGKSSSPSPIGTWRVINKGEWSAGFGTRWIGIDVPWGTFGIHGTNRPSSIGSHASHGCIRMFNKHVEDLYNYISHDSIVVIYGGPYNMYNNKFRKLAPGDTGSDVLEIQRVLKEKGYYKGNLDGKYGEYLKTQVIKYRKDHNLTLNHFVDTELYNALGMQSFE